MRIINEYDDKVYKLASENTKYNSEGKAVMTLDDEWREEKEWDAVFNQLTYSYIGTDGTEKT